MRKRIAAMLVTSLIAVVVIAAVQEAAAKRALSPQNVDKPTAKALFEKLKGLEGTWHGKSTLDWEENVAIHVIAKGTSVTMQSADPKSDMNMLTVYHLDGDRLLLTHYCEAGNQPRLVASAIEDGGRKVTFTFLDGTNMASRNTGHMDKVVLIFIDDDHFNERWTWYQNGKESWMEAVTNERVSK